MVTDQSRQEPERRGDTRQAPPWLPRAAFTVALVLLAVLATLWVAMRLRGLIFMVFVAAFVAVALEPAVQYLTRRGWRRRTATGVVFTAAVVLVAAFVGSLVPVVIVQASSLFGNLPGYAADLQRWLASMDIDVDLLDPGIIDQFRDVGGLLSEYGSSVAGGIFVVGNTVFTVLFRIVTITLFAYYMVAEGPALRRTLLGFLSPERQREALRIWEIAVDRTGGYVYSRLVLAAVAAAFTGLVLTVLGVPYAVVLALWVGVVSQFVPVVGTYIALILPGLVALAQDPVDAVWVVVALVAYQQLENFVFTPQISAHAMSIHPAVSIGAIVAGGSLLGGVGVVLALPVAAIIQAVISTAARRHELIPEAAARSAGEGGDEEPVDPASGAAGDGDVEGVEAVGRPRLDGEAG